MNPIMQPIINPVILNFTYTQDKTIPETTPETPNKQLIRLTESDLHNIIKSCINEVSLSYEKKKIINIKLKHLFASFLV